MRIEGEAAARAAVSILGDALARSGLSSWAFLSHESLVAACAGLPPGILARYGIGARSGHPEAGPCAAVVVSLAYGDGPMGEPGWAAGYGGPRLSIGRFARSNWYAELLLRLKAAVTAAREGLRGASLDSGPPAAWRRLANSRLPEKPLALAAGLGCLGRSGLVLLGARGGPGLPPQGRPIGPGAVLGILLLPFDLDTRLVAGLREAFDHRLAFPSPASGNAGAAARAGDMEGAGSQAGGPGAGRDPCATCLRCLRACPTGALAIESSQTGRVIYRRERCLQHWSALDGEPPAAIQRAWKGRLYGCDACLEACPWFSPAEDRASSGILGPALPAAFFAEASDEEIRLRLKGSALGLSWMSVDAFRRSARLALDREDAGI